MQQKMSPGAPAVEVQFAQKLAANDATTRNKAIKKIRKWFSARTEAFSEAEMMRLWKGLYYCFWMSDKPLVQEELAESISSFIKCFHSQDSSLLFIQSFLQTFGREWFGIDRWRVDKFMMFTRRFLRSSFKFLADKDWDEDLTKQLVEILKNDLVLSPDSKTNIGFRLHVTDVYLEELAKVAHDKLNTDILEMIIDPFFEAIKNSQEDRFRDHVVERIFKHLLRQSDPGIKWQDEEFESGDEDDDEVEDDEDEGDKEEMGDSDEEEQVEDEENGVQLGDDPRAGGVHSVIPQLNVDYAKISSKMFDLGSEEGLKKTTRDAFYELSKMYKDVANDVFPLGPNIEDDEDIEKLKVTKTAKKLLREAEDFKKQNLKNKLEYKKSLKKKNHVNGDVAMNGDKEDQSDNENDGNDSDKNDSDNENDDDNESESENIKPKLSSKELQKARKREQKKRKRERLQREAAEKEESERKAAEEKNVRDKIAKELIDKDIDRKNVESSKKKKKNMSVLEGKVEKVEEKLEKHKALEKKKKKKDKINKINGDSIKEDLNREVNGDAANESRKKKEKKNKLKVESEPAEEIVNKLSETSDIGSDSSKKKKKKKAKETSEADNEASKKVNKRVAETVVEKDSPSPKKPKKDEEQVMKKPGELITDALETAKEKKKKKKLKKALYRIDSDIAFNAPSLSQINLLEKKTENSESNTNHHQKVENETSKETAKPDLVTTPSADSPKTKTSEKKKSKKMKKYNAEASLLVNPDETPVLKMEPGTLTFKEDEKSTPTSSKTKKMINSEPGASPKNSKLFEENNSWSEELKPGEMEIVIPNKNYKGEHKLKAETITAAIPDCPSPALTPAKSFTATFLKKSLSKSAKRGDTAAKIFPERSMSEPRKKKVNVVLTKNQAQEFSQHLKNVKNSPQTPHDPNKNPTKSALKKTPGSGSEAPSSLNPVNLNTQLNARSKAAKLLNGKGNRKRAMDFF